MDEQKTLTLDFIKSLMEPSCTLVWTDYDDNLDNHRWLVQKCLDSKSPEHLWEKADEWRKSNQEYQSLIESVYDEESDFIPHKIPIELIESLGLNFNQFEAVYPLI